MTDISTTCVEVILKVEVSWITSINGIKLWLLTWLVNYVAMLLVVFQLSCGVIGYEDSKCEPGAFWSIFCHSDNGRFIVSQISNQTNGEPLSKLVIFSQGCQRCSVKDKLMK